MSPNKIIAYFVHKEDKLFIKSHMDLSHETASFIMGEATKVQQDLLSQQNILFTVLNDSDKEQNYNSSQEVTQFNKGHEAYDWATGEFEGSSDGFDGSFADSNYLSVPNIEEDEFPGFYKMKIIGPLLEQYNVRLKDIEIEISEYLPNESSYVIRIESVSKYNLISSLDFVEELSYYNSSDTKIYLNLSEPQKWRNFIPFDVLLQRSDDLNDFLSWLKLYKIKMIEAKIDKVRLVVKDLEVAKLVAKHPSVRYMYEYVPPKFFNDLAGQIIGTLKAGTELCEPNLEFEGENQIIGVADTGIDTTHPDLISQIAGTRSYGIPGDVSDVNGHGTHVAGSIVGNGVASQGKIKGIAPKAKIYFQSLLDSKNRLALPLRLQDLYDDAYKNDARIHNNSWGASTESKYTVSSVEVDDFVYAHKDMLLIFAAGNEGSLKAFKNVEKGDVDFYSIGSPGSAKNILTVGCSRSSRTTLGYSGQTYQQAWPESFPYPPFYNNEKISGDPQSMAGFSSRGPCDDDRIKPDVVAPGTDIVSTKSKLADLANYWGGYVPYDQYALLGGTSMASPIVSGFAALVREFYVKKKDIVPSAALLKATIINGCKKLTGRDSLLFHANVPNFNQGYGLIDARKTIPSEGNNFFFYFVDNHLDTSQHFVGSGENFKIKFSITTPGCWVRICLAYTDYPARALQNNLNLMLSNKKELWVGNQDAKTLLKGLDSKNNVEVIIIESAEPGLYTLKVVASNIIKGPQDFALVITSSDINLNI